MLQIGAMLSVAASWLLLSLMFFGLGRLACRLLRLGRPGRDGAILTFWMGWGVAIVLLQLWHFQFTVDYRIFLIVAVLGTLGLALDAKMLSRNAAGWWADTDRNTRIRVSLVVLLVVAFWSSLAIGPPLRTDTANYHLTAVRWNTEYPVIPGLGNLHGRLAFNNSSFLYAAMLDVGPWHHRSHHLAHGLMAVVTILYFLSSVPAAFRADDKRFVIHLVRAFCFPIALLFTYKGTTSFQPDLLTFLIGLLVSTVLLELLCEESSGDKAAKQRTAFSVFAICFLSSVGLTVKLSFLPLGFLASVIALVVAWRQLIATPSSHRFAFVGLFLICSCSAVAALVPWAARGVMLSGYVAFPSTVGAFDVPWRVPEAGAKEMHDAIVGFARRMGPDYRESLGNWNWVGGAIVRELGHVLEFTIPLACVAFSLLGVYRFRNSDQRRPKHSNRVWWFLLPSLAAFLFMLVTAPIPRFAGAAIWVMAIGTMALSLDRMERSSPAFQKSFRMTMALGVLLLIAGVAKSSRYTGGVDSAVGLSPTPLGEFTLRQTESGLPVYVAAEFGWDGPLPNTPYFDPSLALIQEGDLGSGFRIRNPSTVTAAVPPGTDTDPDLLRR
ncbi:MAG: hypothetical protein HKN47_12420 [Pirellulaceae bacterium]|nr:hypothetical protein [Pirellulaceae bacterium]